MITKCYIIEINSNNKSMFEQLDDYGFDYICESNYPEIGYMEVSIDCYPHEISDLEDIMKWYV